MVKVIKNQSYLTLEEVKHAAKHSTRAAIKCSARHWHELAAVPMNVFAESVCASSTSQINMGRPGCALCVKFDECDCVGCPLAEVEQSCHDENSLYRMAVSHKRDFNYATNKRERDVIIKRFRRAAEKLTKLLEKLHGTHEAVGT